jgi:hypothetical protein
MGKTQKNIQAKPQPARTPNQQAAIFKQNAAAWSKHASGRLGVG